MEYHSTYLCLTPFSSSLFCNKYSAYKSLSPWLNLFLTLNFLVAFVHEIVSLAFLAYRLSLVFKNATDFLYGLYILL